MNFAETMRELESLGTEQNRKIYRRHGASEPLFGVSFAHLGKLQKRLKGDHALAEALWASGNTDARHLATMVADPALLSRKALDGWVKGANYYALTDLFVNHVASRSPHAREAMVAWMGSNSEWVERAGWTLLAVLALRDATLEDADLEPFLARIERDIHGAKNWVRGAMNSALISLGAREGALGDKALAAARRIGKVEVDHGETSCKTPEAAGYILKMRAHRAARAASPKAAPRKASAPARKSAAPAVKKPAAKAKRAPARPRA